MKEEKSKLPLPTRVIQLARDLTRKHYVLDTLMLYRVCVDVIDDASREDIRRTIDNLVRDSILFEGKALIKYDSLKNENRKLLWTIIKDIPGIYFSQIKEITGKSNRLIQWHLHVLERFEFIRSVEKDGRKHYFDAYSDMELDDIYCLLQKPDILAIWHKIYKNPGISVARLGKKLGIPRSTLYRKLGEMEERCLIVMDYQQDRIAGLFVMNSPETITRCIHVVTQGEYWQQGRVPPNAQPEST